MLLCVGQFFPENSARLEEFMDYIEGRSVFPLPVYFIGDYGAGAPKVLSVAAKDSANLGFKMDGLKVCDNLFWLKGSGKFTLHGIRSSCTLLYYYVSDFGERTYVHCDIYMSPLVMNV